MPLGTLGAGFWITGAKNLFFSGAVIQAPGIDVFLKKPERVSSNLWGGAPLEILNFGATAYIGKAVAGNIAKEECDRVSVIKQMDSASDLPVKSQDWDSSLDGPVNLPRAGYWERL